MSQRRQFGLIGRNIAYSFSRGYFTDKFKELQLDDCSYVNFDIPDLSRFQDLLRDNKDISGLNVTIPYKQEIIAYLDDLSPQAEKIGAVNTIHISESGKLTGHNTDAPGFAQALHPHLTPEMRKALILGTGGASKAIAHALKSLHIEVQFVSRNPTADEMAYEDLNCEIFKEHLLIINTSPLGTFPEVKNCPDIPYDCFTSRHLAFDLVYNPEQTEFMKRAIAQGAKACNGLQMLKNQAEISWKIWNGLSV